MTIEGNVLVSSAGGKVPLVTLIKKSCLMFETGIQVIAGDSNPAAISQYFADSFWVMPQLEKMNTQKISEECKLRGINRVIPTRDGELLFFAKNKKELESNGVSVMISSPETVEICLDKLRFASLGIEAGLPVIPAYESLPANAEGTWVVKERYGAGSLSMGLNLSAAEAHVHAARLKAPIFQPFLSGMQEFSADIYVDRSGHMKGCVVRTRDVVVNGESQITTTTANPTLVNVCQRLVGALPFYGHIIIQAFVDASGGVHLIEVNPRFGGASSLAIEAGLDSFYWFLLESQGADLRDTPFLHDPARRLRQVRYARDFIEVV